ncbi:hypothetical protein Q0M94_27975 (plasmid) [Deinococcus radiomollis]|uniref:hypothetical protein n=1 Tax=Deinococcus radiomollis TaxID=468916 RepID=UPI0038923A2C
MPVAIPPEQFYSLNQAADRCGMNRQDFRVLIGEFERRARSLPKRINEHNEESKYIPAPLLHVFEEAVLWMDVHDVDEAGGMSYALGMRQSVGLRQLATAVSDREPLLKLPRELRETAAELKAVLSKPQIQSVNILDQKEVAASINRLSDQVRLEAWTLAALVLMACLLGAAIGVTFTVRTMGHRIENVEARINQSQYETGQQLNRIEKRLKARR